MQIRFVPVAAMLTLILSVSSLSAQAKEGVNAGKSVQADPDVVDAVDALALASQLADYGYDNESAVSLVAAARILMDNNYQDEGRWEDDTTTGLGGGPGDDKEGRTVDLDPDRFLADAAMMTHDQHLEAVIERMANSPQSKGAVGGPIYASRRMEARTTHWYDATFAGGEYARVVVDGDGDTDLDCWIYDENNNLIDSDTDYTDYCILEFSPNWTGVFHLKVSNLGYVWNGAVITSN